MRNATLSKTEEILLAEALLQDDLERVAPKLEPFRQLSRIKGCRGGRGSGAKSWSIASLLVQRAHHERIHVACLREVQLTLEESVWKLIRETIERLRLPGWRVTKEAIDYPRRGSHFIFRGISDLRADQIKSLEAFDVFWIEEAQSISAHSLDVLMPTLRAPGSELWFSMNPEEDRDPIIARLWDGSRKDAILVDLLPGRADNPWWTAELQQEMDADFRRDPDLAEHIWNGLPLKQGARSVMSRAAVRAAMERDLPIDTNGVIELGVDVARFGDDDSTIYKRRGLKVIEYKVMSGTDTQEVARTVWDIAGRDGQVKVKVDDDGVGGGVTDKLRDLGAYVIPVHNGATANDMERFTTCADEQWFGFPVDQADIPDDPILMEELTRRLYKYTPKDQRKIESKQDYKKRYGKSPDRADGLLLCFYDPEVWVIQDGLSAASIGL